MKKVILGLALIGAMASCSKQQCSDCTEQATQAKGGFCGSKSQCDEFEETLHEQGNLYGQNWNCKRTNK